MAEDTLPVAYICRKCGWITKSKAKLPRCSKCDYSLTAKTLEQRFFSHVNKLSEDSGGHWMWLANKDSDGYGMTTVNYKCKRATHVSWYLKYHVWPDRFVCHICDIPGCVNPDHLFLGTNMDNMQDCIAKGRHVMQRMSHMALIRKLTAVLTEKQVLEIRRDYKYGRTTYKEMSHKYNVHPVTIGKIVRRER